MALPPSSLRSSNLALARQTARTEGVKALITTHALHHVENSKNKKYWEAGFTPLGILYRPLMKGIRKKVTVAINNLELAKDYMLDEDREKLQEEYDELLKTHRSVMAQCRLWRRSFDIRAIGGALSDLDVSFNNFDQKISGATNKIEQALCIKEKIHHLKLKHRHGRAVLSKILVDTPGVHLIKSDAQKIADAIVTEVALTVLVVDSDLACAALLRLRGEDARSAIDLIQDALWMLPDEGVAATSSGDGTASSLEQSKLDLKVDNTLIALRDASGIHPVLPENDSPKCSCPIPLPLQEWKLLKSFLEECSKPPKSLSEADLEDVASFTVAVPSKLLNRSFTHEHPSVPECQEYGLDLANKTFTPYRDGMAASRDCKHSPDDSTECVLLTVTKAQELQNILYQVRKDTLPASSIPLQVTDKRTKDFNNRLRGVMAKLSWRTGLLPEAMVVDIAWSEDVPSHRGGYADVFKSSWVQPDGQPKVVALKRARLDNFHAAPQSNICREIVHWLSLRSPYILELVGVNFSQHPRFPPCAVSEWMEDSTIENHFRSLGEEQKQSEIGKRLWEVTKGVEYLHSEDVIHGDLKSMNILIKPNNGVACLTDFGVSVLMEASDSTVTSVGNSQRWKSPELLKFSFSDVTIHASDTYRATKCSDIYALGNFFVEAHDGVPPHYEYPDVVIPNRVYKDKESAPRPRGAIPVTKSLPNWRPSRETCALAMTNDVWTLVEECTEYAAKDRPNVAHVVDRLQKIFEIDNEGQQ